MRLRRRHTRSLPLLNTAALPDLIFTVLFFFMIVTHMRNTDVKVKYTVPEGQQLTKVQHKAAITYLYIGRDAKGQTRLQVNDAVVSLDNLAGALENAYERIPDDEKDFHTVSIKADRDVPLSVIAKVKMALSEAGTLQVSYSATEKEYLKD